MWYEIAVVAFAVETIDDYCDAPILQDRINELLVSDLKIESPRLPSDDTNMQESCCVVILYYLLVKSIYYTASSSSLQLNTRTGRTLCLETDSIFPIMSTPSWHHFLLLQFKINQLTFL